ncbi:MAG: leucine-rich repeat domain-containing protein [Sporocytophaga sp.]|uniref:leucine-rich repeat domain-containing protein n=1 Tax=Sporocytophaga sp. TaxID=2231183 RepID=UPI001B153E56|nr:leucine-rich repeat domain-containing protein [Sporocytophaga sp.]MBO9701389.1 leucine-rich repeat domain-containing protein [Sporocytophaga sp.]
MKKVVLFLGIFLGVCVTKVLSQTAVIPDPAFRQFLVTNHPSLMNANQELITANAAAVTGVFYCSEANISSLEGIQNFTGIKELQCLKNKLTTLPNLSNLTGLTQLNASGNQLTILPALNSLINLQVLNVMENKITAFPDLSGLTNIKEIRIYKNQLSSIPDLSGLSNLQKLSCYENNLTSIGKMPASLKELNFGDNRMTVIPDISLATGLTLLAAYTNQISSLPDLSTFTSLVHLNLGTNKISSVPNLSTLTNLNHLTLDNNLLSDLPDLSGLNQLTFCWLHKNFFTFEDLSPSAANPNFGSWTIHPQNPIQVSPSYKGMENQRLEISLNYNSSISGLTFSWYQNDSLRTQTAEPVLEIPSLQKSDNGSYYCVVTSSQPSLSALTLTSTEFTIIMIPDFLKGSEELTLSPNGDGKNDEIYFEEHGTLKVYASSGDLVDQRSSPCYWNGTTRSGRDLEIGYYVIRINDEITYHMNIVR